MDETHVECGSEKRHVRVENTRWRVGKRREEIGESDGAAVERTF